MNKLSEFYMDPDEQLADCIRRIPYWQKYKVRRHDPPTPEGYVYTLQLIGPPAMIDGEFIGWDKLQCLK